MSDALKEAQELYQESLDALRDQRIQIEEDLRFSDPSKPDQWDAVVKQQRENDPGGVRPCLVLDQTGQYVANVAGQVEKQPPSIHAIPVGGGADKKAAEQIDGRYRHIEYASRASQHYTRALTSAARTGVGYLVIRPDYINRALGWQEPRISSEPDPLNVIFDPWSTETDGSDATFGYILTELNPREFKRKWGNKEQVNFGDTQALQKHYERKSVLVAEQWYKEEKTKNCIVYIGQDGQEATGSEEEYFAACQAAGMELEYIRNYKEKTQIVKWRRMSGVDILEESTYPADSIGIVPVYGYVGFSDGRMSYCGIPRRARHSQQSYNYHVSEQQAYIGTAPRSPWLASKRAVAGVEALWDRASIESRAFLPYNDIDELGAIAQPNRINPSTSMMNHEAGAAQALRDIQASIGMYQANLGAPSNEQSGVAIESRKQQGEASTAHFPSHMAASLGQVGKIIMQMDARLSDTQRKQPTIGIDGSAGSVNVDPDQKSAFQRSPDGVTINPSVGEYGVMVVVGASYSTQRTQTNAAFTEMMRGNPELAQTIAPFWAQTLDFPGSDKFAQAMATMAPAPIKAILQPEGQEDAPDPAKLAQQISEMQQALQEAIQHAHDAQQDADEAIAEAANAKRIAEVKERELDIKAYDSETKRLQVTGASDEQVKFIVNDLIQTMLDNPDPLPGDQESYETPAEPMPEEQGEPMPDPNEERHNSVLKMIQDLHGKIDQSNQMETHIVRDPMTGKVSHAIKKMPGQMTTEQQSQGVK